MNLDDALKAISSVGLPAFLLVCFIWGLVRVAKYVVLTMLRPAVETIVKKAVETADCLVETQREIQTTQVEQTKAMMEMRTSLENISVRLCGGGRGKPGTRRR